MNHDIELYLSISRGKNNYRESQDDIIDYLASNFKSKLKNNKISIVVIWSVLAKNEIITNEDGSKTLIWDTNYWLHCAYYCANLLRLEQFVNESEAFIKIQCDALWRDLLRLVIYRSDNYSSNSKLLLAKYYLLYGTRQYFKDNSAKTIESMNKDLLINLANAKIYAFLHELAHITANEHIEFYASILKNALNNSEFQQNIFICLDVNHSLTPTIRKTLQESINNLLQDLNHGIYDSSSEIIADMRALQSMCSIFMQTYPDEIPDGFLKYRDGIGLARSFNLRIWNIKKYTDEIMLNNNLLVSSEYIYSDIDNINFLLRDILMELLEAVILELSFANRFSKSFYLKYNTASKISGKTIAYVDESLSEHIEKIIDRVKSESKVLESISDEQSVNDVLSYLLYYPREETDSLNMNCPIKQFSPTSLIF